MGTKAERRRFFERLCELRALYAIRGPDDRLGTITVEAAIACAELALMSVRMVGEPIPDAQAEELERHPHPARSRARDARGR